MTNLSQKHDKFVQVSAELVRRQLKHVHGGLEVPANKKINIKLNVHPGVLAIFTVLTSTILLFMSFYNFGLYFH